MTTSLYVGAYQKKNSQLHFHIETATLDNLKEQAREQDITLSELCRKKLRIPSPSIKNIEEMLTRIYKKIIL
jgi:hypothetical protein